MRNKKWTIEEIETLKSSANGSVSIQFISDKIGRTRNSVKRKLDTLGLTNPYKKTIHSSDDSFWAEYNKINCYWAGFSAADGCIRDNGGSSVFSIVLQGQDYEHLKIFAKHAKLTQEVKIIRRKYGGIYREYAEIKVSNKKWKKDLEKNFGIIPRKTFNFKSPNVPEKYQLYWLAGFIDGDGCYSKLTQSGHISISAVAATEESLNIFSRIISEYKGEKTSITKTTGKRSYFKVNLSCYPAAKLAFDVMNLSCPHLRRKYEKVKALLCEKYNLSLPPYEEKLAQLATTR